MNPTFIKYPALVIFFISVYFSKAQNCNPCSSNGAYSDSLVYNVYKTDTSTYSLNAGQTLCIHSTGTFKGTIINNGGTICNKGRFFPKVLTFTSGYILNSKTIKLKSDFNLTTLVNVINSSESILNIEGDLTLSGGTLINEGLINIQDKLQNNSGKLANKAIINCNERTGTNTVTDYQIGLINAKN